MQMFESCYVFVMYLFDKMIKSISKIHISGRREHIAEISPRIVTQGKTFDDNEERNAAAHAVDKDLSTHAVTKTENGAAWLKLEFDKTYFINKIVIYYRFYTDWFDPNGSCAISETSFKGCVDNNNNIDVSVFQGEVKQNSCGTLQMTYGLEQSDQIYTLVCNTKGDTVKLSKTGGAIAVYEVVTTSTGNSQVCTFFLLFFFCVFRWESSLGSKNSLE